MLVFLMVLYRKERRRIFIKGFAILSSENSSKSIGLTKKKKKVKNLPFISFGQCGSPCDKNSCKRK